jgi:tRNA pseudouridine55 synthase
MNAPPAPASPSGLLIIDKHEGITSMGICRNVRWRLVQGGAPKRVKVGHGGTLDPLATGVLVVLVGKATRMCDAVMRGTKRYIATVDLSQTSTTDDREGERTLAVVPREPTREEVEAACRRFVGTIQQRPPAYSAIKVGGKRSYKLARKAEGGEGEMPELAARPVDVHSIAVVEYVWPRVVMDVVCGKGTYIRSLARDIGGALGTGGMLEGLRRTAVGPFGIERAVRLDQLPATLGQGDLLDPAGFAGHCAPGADAER